MAFLPSPSRAVKSASGTALGLSGRCLRRFVPPWEKDGKSADDFFSGLMQSRNPIQQRRKMAGRESVMQDEQIRDGGPTPEDERRRQALEDYNAEVVRRQQDFLPYGAVPQRYFESSGMAAWGTYQTQLSPVALSGGSTSADKVADGTGYSSEVTSMLLNDLRDKVPYSDLSPPFPGTAASWPLGGTAGVVLDIDGVVYRSGKVIDGADVAIRKLLDLRVPLVFMTNGGGLTEAAKATQLSTILGVTIDPSQVILSHTPMQFLAPLFRDKPVLIAGSPSCVEVAKSYGFGMPISILQFQAEHPELVPFKKWGDLRHAEPHSIPFPEIAAVLQLDVLEDAFGDAQTILDVLTAPKGKVGTGVSGTQCIPYYQSSDDLLWAAAAHLPRLGHGALREMMSSVFESVTGNSLSVTLYGKPRAIAFAFAERRIRELSAKLGWAPGDLRAIFMVGDNIETDITGCNAAGGVWTSVHVLSGIGSAPSARRTLPDGDDEMEWMEETVSKVPHYVAPTMDHFVRELLAFPERAMLQSKRSHYGLNNPAQLVDTYNFS